VRYVQLRASYGTLVNNNWGNRNAAETQTLERTRLVDFPHSCTHDLTFVSSLLSANELVYTVKGLIGVDKRPTTRLLYRVCEYAFQSATLCCEKPRVTARSAAQGTGSSLPRAYWFTTRWKSRSNASG